MERDVLQLRAAGASGPSSDLYPDVRNTGDCRAKLGPASRDRRFHQQSRLAVSYNFRSGKSAKRPFLLIEGPNFETPGGIRRPFSVRLPEEERKKLGRAGITQAQAEAKYAAGEERRFQEAIAGWLDLEGIYFEFDRMDKRTSGKKGRADFRICVPPGDG